MSADTKASPARAIIERARWPHGPRCPKCGSEHVSRLSTRPVILTCCGCRSSQFSATAGTPLHQLRISDEQFIEAWRALKVKKQALTVTQIAHRLDVAYLTARNLKDRIVRIEVHMPDFAARLTEEIARADYEAQAA